MEKIKNLPLMERPREKLQYQGVAALSDEELLAVLLGSGTPKVPLNQICANLLGEYQMADIAGMDMKTLCGFKGIGPAKATILLAVNEFCRRANLSGQLLKDEPACYHFLRPLLAGAEQLQYILLLISTRRELLAFCEAGSVLPDIGWIMQLACKAGAARILLGRNGWPAFSNAESRYLVELRAACAALGIVCEGLMAVGPERFKMI